MVEFRSFRNTDPPQLVEIWRSQSNQRGLMQPMSVGVFERFVLSKPTFDQHGLQVAVEGDKLLGFAHAGLGPNAAGSWTSCDAGVTSLVMLRPEADNDVALGLLSACENYLKERGAKVLYGGGSFSLAPFYTGLYAGSQFSGILDSDARTQAIFTAAGYQVFRRAQVLNRELASFRPVVDRTQMQIRRQTTLETLSDPPVMNLWEAVLFEPFERMQSLLMPRDGGAPLASVYFWTMETMVGAWGVHAVGIMNLEVSAPKRRQGLATFLLGESLRQLQSQGIALAEVHVPETFDSALRLFRVLGFEKVDQSAFYRKEADSART